MVPFFCARSLVGVLPGVAGAARGRASLRRCRVLMGNFVLRMMKHVVRVSASTIRTRRARSSENKSSSGRAPAEMKEGEYCDWDQSNSPTCRADRHRLTED